MQAFLYAIAQRKVPTGQKPFVLLSGNAFIVELNLKDEFTHSSPEILGFRFLEHLHIEEALHMNKDSLCSFLRSTEGRLMKH